MYILYAILISQVIGSTKFKDVNPSPKSSTTKFSAEELGEPKEDNASKLDSSVDGIADLQLSFDEVSKFGSGARQPIRKNRAPNQMLLSSTGIADLQLSIEEIPVSEFGPGPKGPTRRPPAPTSEYDQLKDEFHSVSSALMHLLIDIINARSLVPFLNDVIVIDSSIANMAEYGKLNSRLSKLSKRIRIQFPDAPDMLEYMDRQLELIEALVARMESVSDLEGWIIVKK